MARQRETHWVKWLLTIAMVAGIGWLATDQLGVRRERAESAAYQPPADLPPPTHEISVRAGASVKAPIGVFSIRVDHIGKDSMNLTVSSETKDTYRFKNAKVGQRLMIPSHDGMYHLDVVRLDGRTAHLTMSNQR